MAWKTVMPLPGAEGDVVDPTAVGAADVVFGPVVDEEGGVRGICFAGGVGDAEERVDGVAAAAVDDGAGGAEEGAVEGGVWGWMTGGRGGRRTRFGGVGVEIFLWWWVGGVCSAAKVGRVLKAVAAAAESWSIWRRVRVGFGIEGILEQSFEIRTPVQAKAKANAEAGPPPRAE